MAQKITEYSRLLTLQLQWDWGGAQLSGASLKPLISLPVSIRQAFFYNTYFGNSPVIPLSQAFVCIWNTSTSDNKRNGDELTWFWLVLFGWCCHNYFFWGGGGGSQHAHQQVVSGHYILDHHSFAVFQIIRLCVIRGLQYSFKLQISHVWFNHVQKHTT